MSFVNVATRYWHIAHPLLLFVTNKLRIATDTFAQHYVCSLLDRWQISALSFIWSTKSIFGIIICLGTFVLFWCQDTRNWCQDTRYWCQDTRYWCQDTRYWCQTNTDQYILVNTSYIELSSVTKLYKTRATFYSHNQSTRLTKPILTNLLIARRDFVQIFYTEFHPKCSVNVGSAATNSSTPVSKALLPSVGFHKNSRFLDDCKEVLHRILSKSDNRIGCFRWITAIRTGRKALFRYRAYLVHRKNAQVTRRVLSYQVFIEVVDQLMVFFKFPRHVIDKCSDVSEEVESPWRRNVTQDHKLVPEACL